MCGSSFASLPNVDVYRSQEPDEESGGKHAKISRTSDGLTTSRNVGGTGGNKAADAGVDHEVLTSLKMALESLSVRGNEPLKGTFMLP